MCYFPVVIDLSLKAGLAAARMVRDARSRDDSSFSVLPYLLLTLVFVSLGPLLYIVVKGSKRNGGKFGQQ